MKAILYGGLILCLFCLVSCAPVRPSLLECLFLAPSTSEVQVVIYPEPPPGTVICYQLLDNNRKNVLSGKRESSDCLNFYFPEECHPYYLVLEIVFPAAEGVIHEKYERRINKQNIEIIRHTY